MIRTVVYTSTARDDLTTFDLAAILNTARAYNSAHAITGVLLYRDGRFLQVLEGSRFDLARLLRSIRHDRRHHDVRIVLRGKLRERRFPDWSMGFRSGVEADAAFEARATNLLDTMFDIVRTETGGPS